MKFKKIILFVLAALFLSSCGLNYLMRKENERHHDSNERYDDRYDNRYDNRHDDNRR